MTRPLVLAIVLALAAPLPTLAQEAAAGTAQAASPAWVARSNELAGILVEAQAEFSPEGFSFLGIPGYDDKVSDFGPDAGKRGREATARARDALKAKLAVERDPQVRQDLELLIASANDSIESSETYERLTLPWVDAPQLVFSGIQSLLSDQVQPERRARALDRLKAYVGMDGTHAPLTEQAMARYTERAGDAALLRPTRLEVEQALGNVDTYVEGIRKLFAKYQVAGADEALDAMDAQLHAYADWARGSVLPDARTDTVLPPALYALSLKQVGIDIDPKVLVQRAQLEFMETRAAMQALAPRVVAEKGLSVKDPNDYVEVIQALKRDTIPNDALEARYRTVIDRIDPIIREARIVDVPNRPMVMRLGTEAESAAQPAPHFKPAPLVGNTGQQGQFVLPVAVPQADGDALQYDDFNFDAVRWTLSAHEGRPGHELQFTAMVERGVSLARTMFAFNSVNVEGWALYAEAEMVPYEPVDGQLIALQFRLLRAARAILDPMLNLGLTDRESAGRVLREKVGMSEAMTKQELDRYTFNAPGQAGAYFYGYSRILELRMATELALGDRFDRLAFNNFLLDQGLLPPDLLAQAVNEAFIPSQRER
ncbi:DUF885 domain-containing protein [Marilutibacter aestuarii]|uniref:DUF885 domain-containing protein n=1 Tax=Marilutibacter aestuarii TaxID=1706195 RepID=A0A508AME1_9GAMM|nr:DUF885 domain-containing protein [Lysobacter aestuarii]TQD51290.1 DUF885 domain-containing protein [Lysobacter aestuarii]